MIPDRDLVRGPIVDFERVFACRVRFSFPMMKLANIAETLVPSFLA